MSRLTDKDFSFKCPMSWDAMKDTANGKFCSKCSKEVFDLTHCSIDEISALQAKHGSICGSIRVAQAAVVALSLSAAACQRIERTTGAPMPVPSSSNNSGADHKISGTPKVMDKVGPSAENDVKEAPIKDPFEEAAPNGQKIPNQPIIMGVVCPQPQLNKNDDPRGPVIDG